MPVVSQKLGPGTFSLGAGPLELSCQLSQCSINPTENVTTNEAIPMLCGDDLAAEDEFDYTFTVSGTILQDLTAAGVVDYTWTHMGEEVAFTFVPNTVAARQVEGTCRVVPLTIGGEVKKRNTSDFEWAIIGTPVFGAV